MNTITGVDPASFYEIMLIKDNRLLGSYNEHRGCPMNKFILRGSLRGVGAKVSDTLQCEVQSAKINRNCICLCNS